MNGRQTVPVRTWGVRRPECDLAELLRLAADGDADAFMRFYDATIDRVYLLARACSAGPAGVDDVVKSVFERAWRAAAGQARSGLSPMAWLLRDLGSPPSSTAC